MQATDTSKGETIPSAVVLADSLAFPRASQGQQLMDAWPQRLVNDGLVGLLWMRARQAGTSGELLEESHQLAGYVGSLQKFRVGIVQVGIVDCSPRPLPRWAQGLVNLVPRLPGILVRFYPLLTRIRKKPWVSETRFLRNMSELLRTMQVFCEHALVVPILPPANSLVSKLGDFTPLVARYNELLSLAVTEQGDFAELLQLRLTKETKKRVLLPDGHHLTKEGHKMIADTIKGTLR